MTKNISRTDAKKDIDGFFEDIEDKTPKEIKKIKRMAMRYNLPLKEKRKMFCKKCYTPYKNPKIKIKNKMKSIECEKCEYISRWKIK